MIKEKLFIGERRGFDGFLFFLVEYVLNLLHEGCSFN